MFDDEPSADGRSGAARPGAQRAGGRGLSRPSAGAARWSDRALALCALAGLIAAAAVTRTWARATLSDRGSALLVVTRSGWQLRPAGPLVVAFGLVTALVCLLAHRRGRAAFGALLALLGAAVTGLALSRLHAADPLVHTIGRLRIGTFQTDEPVAAGTAGAGLWTAVVAGIVMVLTAVGWLRLSRRAAAESHASTAGGWAGPAGAAQAGFAPVAGPAPAETPGAETPGAVASGAVVSGAGVSGPAGSGTVGSGAAGSGAGSAGRGGIQGGDGAAERGVDHGL
ncbi:Trp biosynthesis-associated membrane protein [Frankia sp. AvcI1]|uniref:Trp biosynthesis-associated membrane protein n=1 Tax=Frankia sp. AvcI1 TaxID=573496 RepID=UPI0006EC1C2B|nr:Trp biosynthesis-associated membrane protein [Frankia sp. AvcI1]